MIQIVFFALLVVALFAGAFSYFNPHPKAVDPWKFISDSGLNSTDTINRKRFQQINMVTSKGLLEIHKQMDDLAVAQSKFLDTLKDQQQILSAVRSDAESALIQARQSGAGAPDILHLEELTSQMKDDQNLLVARGQYLVSLNDQLTKGRQQVLEQIDLANFNTQNILDNLKQQNAALNNQSSDFFDQVAQNNQQVRDQMDQLQDKFNGISQDSELGMKWRSASDRLNQLMEKSREDRQKLADVEEKNRQATEKSKQDMADAQDRLHDLEQHTRDVIQDERQKEEDQKQHLADQQDH